MTNSYLLTLVAYVTIFVISQSVKLTEQSSGIKEAQNV